MTCFQWCVFTAFYPFTLKCSKTLICYRTTLQCHLHMRRDVSFSKNLHTNMKGLCFRISPLWTAFSNTFLMKMMRALYGISVDDSMCFKMKTHKRGLGLIVSLYMVITHHWQLINTINSLRADVYHFLSHWKRDIWVALSLIVF